MSVVTWVTAPSVPDNQFCQGGQRRVRAQPPTTSREPPSTPPKPFPPPAQVFKVAPVIDGDTVQLSNGEEVRLIGVDTPETEHPHKPVQPFGKEASAFTKQLVEGKEVRLEFDVQWRDKYRRLMAYVYIRDTMLNAELVR
jgi:micrococcal nuclease